MNDTYKKALTVYIASMKKAGSVRPSVKLAATDSSNSRDVIGVFAENPPTLSNKPTGKGLSSEVRNAFLRLPSSTQETLKNRPISEIEKYVSIQRKLNHLAAQKNQVGPTTGLLGFANAGANTFADLTIKPLGTLLTGELIRDNLALGKNQDAITQQALFNLDQVDKQLAQTSPGTLEHAKLTAIREQTVKNLYDVRDHLKNTTHFRQITNTVKRVADTVGKKNVKNFKQTYIEPSSNFRNVDISIKENAPSSASQDQLKAPPERSWGTLTRDIAVNPYVQYSGGAATGAGIGALLAGKKRRGLGALGGGAAGAGAVALARYLASRNKG